MLTIVNYNQDEYNFPCLLVLGCFDALHIGHDELLKKAKLQAKINGLDLGVMMFADGKGDKQIYSFEERVALLEQYNVKFVLKIEYTEEFKKTKPLEFIEILDDKLNLKALMSGKDFRFGDKAAGKSTTLKKFGEDEENAIWYIPVKDIMYGEQKVSTTWIKELIENGRVKKVARMLGRKFSVTGEVMQGKGRGEKLLGFPTVNVFYPEWKVQIKQGVYGVECTVDGEKYKGIANYGAQPTFNDDNVELEVHLIGFSGDLYGKSVTVEFARFLRDIRKFASPEELKAQLTEDLAQITGDEVEEEADDSDDTDETVEGND